MCTESTAWRSPPPKRICGVTYINSFARRYGTPGVFVSGPPGDLPEEDVYAGTSQPASGNRFCRDYGGHLQITDGGITWTQAKHSSNEGGGNAGFTSIAFGGGTPSISVEQAILSIPRPTMDQPGISSVSGLTKAPYVLAGQFKGPFFAGTMEEVSSSQRMAEAIGTAL